MTLTVSAVSRDQIKALWHTEGPQLCRALRHGRGEYEPHHVKARLEDGRWLLWRADDDDGRTRGLAATEIVSYEPDTRPHLWVILGAGYAPDEVVHSMWEPIRAHAKIAGCSQIRFLGRPGWARSGAVPQEFKRTHDVWSAPVED